MKKLLGVFILMVSANLLASESLSTKQQGIEMKEYVPVHKIMTQDQFQQLETEGTFAGSPDDLRDGFIHLSTAVQVDYVVNKYFKDVRPLYIVRYSDENFLAKLIWEPNSKGDLFPHLYHEPLRFDLVQSYQVILGEWESAKN